MVAAFICSMVLGQNVPTQNFGKFSQQVISELSLSDAKANGWVGYNNLVMPVALDNNKEAGIMLSAALRHFDEGNKITKIRFYPVYDPNYPATNYTLKIYVNPDIDMNKGPLFAPNSAVYSQNCTVSLGAQDEAVENEITLSKPFTIPAGTEFIMVVVKASGKCAVAFSQRIDDSAIPWPLSFLSPAQGGYWDMPYFYYPNQGETENDARYCAMAFQVYVSSSGAGISDLTANAFKVYPNPSAGVVNVSVKESSTVNVYDVTGKLVNTAHVNADETSVFTLKTAGIYFVNVNGAVQKVFIN